MIESCALYKEGLRSWYSMVDTLFCDDASDVLDLLSRIDTLYLQNIDHAHQASKALFQRCKKRTFSPDLTIRIFLTHAQILWGVGQFSAAIRVLNQALKKTNVFSVGHYRAEIYLRRGIVFFSQKRYLNSLEDLALAAEMAVESMNSDVAIEACLYIGSVYQIFDKQAAGDELLRLGFQFAQAIDSSRLIAKSTVFLSARLIMLQQYQSALDILYQSETSLLEYGDMTWVVEAGKNVAICYQKIGRHEEAELYFSAMLAIARQQKIHWAVASLAVHYAEFLLRDHQLALAIEMLDLAEFGIETYDDLYLHQKSTQLRIEAYKELGDFRLALQSCRRYEVLKISWIESVIFGNSIQGSSKLNRLCNLMDGIKKTQQDLEGIMDLSVFQGSTGRSEMLKEKCLKMPEEHAVIFVEVVAEFMSRRLVDEKVKGILREFCLANDIWLRIGIGEYLIVFGDGASQNELLRYELSSIIKNFPWSWHDCEPPDIKISLVSPEAAVKKIAERVG